jgi:hypothetical protein
MFVNTCFDRLEIVINGALLSVMQSHLAGAPKDEQGMVDAREDTDFDRWMHGQIYQCDYNAV